jgi:hypothetical protein
MAAPRRSRFSAKSKSTSLGKLGFVIPSHGRKSVFSLAEIIFDPKSLSRHDFGELDRFTNMSKLVKYFDDEIRKTQGGPR